MRRALFVGLAAAGWVFFAGGLSLFIGKIGSILFGEVGALAGLLFLFFATGATASWLLERKDG